MAWSVTSVKKTVVGDMRCHIISCVADAATFNVDTGLTRIYGHAIGAQSLSTAGVKAYANSGAGGTSLGGYIGCSGFVSGDNIIFTVFGR